MIKWTQQIRAIGLALALAYPTLGCGPAQPQGAPAGMIRGKVIYKGEPLPRGFLHFYNGTRYLGMGVIWPDGSGVYEAFVPPGPVQAIVKWEPRPDEDDPNRSQPRRLLADFTPDDPQARLLDEVQQKYGSLKTARPLTFDVAPGEQTWDINLD